MAKIGVLDTGIFLGYFVLVLVIGFLAGRKKKKSARDYFVASNKLPWYLIGFGMLASSVSTEQFIGSCGFAYKWGLPVFNWELSNFVAMLIMLWIFLPVYLNKKIITIPQYLELRFGSGPRNIYAVISIFALVFIMLAGVVYTGGFLLEQIFGMNMQLGNWLMVIVAGSITVFGGLISVAWTQLLQGILLLGGGLIVAVAGLQTIDGGFSAIVGTGARAHLIQPLNHPEIPWTSVLVLTIPVNIWYWCTNQPLIQSCLGARSRWDGKMGIILAGFLVIISAMAIEFPGLIAYALNSNLEKPDMAFPFVVDTLVSSGLRGLVLAGLCGAVMSTIEALVHSASALFTLELYHKVKTNASEGNLVTTGRIVSTVVLILGALWAPMVGKFPSIFEFFQKCWFFIAAPVSALFILAILWKRTTKTAAFWTLIMCFPLFFLPYLLRLGEQEYAWSVNEFNLAGIVFILSLLFCIIVSLATEPPKTKQVESLVWQPFMNKLEAEEMPSGYAWYKNLVMWSAIWVAVMIAIYAEFW
ncbi:MAG: sodium/solute symporter [Gemmatimonadota bacterium]|nr:sodium/solute symporter [Gemmatimonadota bacterium]